MKLRLDNLIYTTDDEVKIATLIEKGAEEVKEELIQEEVKEDKKTTKATDKK